MNLDDVLHKMSKLPKAEVQLLQADAKVIEAMNNKQFREELNELQKEALHEKGWSINRMYKSRMKIPADAYSLLPPEYRSDRKLLKRWVQERHPYLQISK